MRRPRLSQEQIERAIAMREKVRSLECIGRAIGCSGKVLSWHFLKWAVDPPKPAPLRLDYHLRCPTMKRGNHIVRAYTPEDDATLLELERQGWTDSQIGRALNRRPNSVRGRLMTLAWREERAAA